MIESFEDRMIQRVRKTPYPTDKSLDQLITFVRDGISRAQVYGLESKSQIQRFLDYIAGLGPDFDHDPHYSWAGKILKMEGVSAADKIREIDNFLLFSPEGDR